MIAVRVRNSSPIAGPTIIVVAERSPSSHRTTEISMAPVAMPFVNKYMAMSIPHALAWGVS